jgi:O-antigen/teichoic acid export membrane protein
MNSRERNLLALLSSAGIVAVGRIVGSVTTIAERIAVGRLLTPAAYGEVSIGIAVLSFSSTIALVGFTQGVPRYVSRYDDEADRRGVWVSGLAFTGTLAILVAGALYLNADVLATRLLERTDSPRMLSLFALALPFYVGMKIGVGTIRGYERTIYKTYTQDLVYPLTRIALLVALIGIGYEVLAAGYAYLVAAVLAFVVSHVFANRLVSLVGPFRTHIREVLTFSTPVVISGFLNTLLTWTDTILLGFYTDSAVVGDYSAAYPIAGGMLIVLSSFGFLYLPLTSRLDADDEHREIDLIYKTTTKWVYIVTFPAFLTFVFFPADVIRVFFGPQYTEASLVLVVLSIGFFSNAIGGRNRETLSGLGVTKFLLVTNGTAFALNIALNVLLIPEYGALGAAVASAVSIIGLNLTALAILKLKFDISPFSRWSTRTFVVLPATLLPVGALVARSVSLSAISLFPFLVAVGLASVAVVSLTGCLQSEDWIALEFVESTVGVRVPLIRRFLPARPDEAMG